MILNNKDFFNQYSNAVFRTAHRYLQSDDLAQDIVQEVFTTIWQKRGTLHDVKNIEQYLTTIARNRTFRELKKWSLELKLREEFLQESELITQEEPEITPYNQLLKEAVALLPKQQKRVFELGKQEGLSHDAIAKQMNLSQGTVKNHMVRALSFIRQQVTERIGFLLLFLFN